MPAAARVGDRHICNHPGHVGGPVLTGDATVTIGGEPAARVADRARCHGAPDVIVEGDSTVTIGGRFAATRGVATHGGRVASGFATVMIGEHPLADELRRAAEKRHAIVGKPRPHERSGDAER